MRAILAMLLILTSVQPAPVLACAMHGDSGTSDHAEMPSDMTHDMHGDMAHGDMNHGMSHDMPDSSGSHDCCNSGDTGNDGCDSSGCLSCAVTVAAVFAPAFTLAAAPAVSWSTTHAERLAPSHDTHPYRPPRPFS